MEQDVKIADAVDLKLSVVAGKMRMEISASAPNAGVGLAGGAFVEADAAVMADKLIEALEGVSPGALVPLEEIVKAAIKARLMGA